MPAFLEENLAVTPRCVGILGCQPEEHGGLGTLALAGMELSLLWAPWLSVSLHGHRGRLSACPFNAALGLTPG